MKDEPTGARPDVPGANGWLRDLALGLAWALAIVASLLFYSATASHFIYVDF